MSNLSDVSILITTFLRDGYLFDCVERIKKNLSECTIVVVDDGRQTDYKTRYYDDLADAGHCAMRVPFDTGLSEKRNVGVNLTRTKYVLLGCDDFDFSTKEVREGIEKLVKVLDTDLAIDIASGRVNSSPYEGFLSLKEGVLKETLLSVYKHLPEMVGDIKVYPVDLTVNYFLARTEVLAKYPWDSRMKIGGEHGDFFLELKNNNRKTVYVPGVNINTLPENNGKVSPDYWQYRQRAVDLGHKIYLEKRGIKEFIGFDFSRVVVRKESLMDILSIKTLSDKKSIRKFQRIK
jgi:glycosyltransferase involved in cell wall biosynthesis